MTIKYFFDKFNLFFNSFFVGFYSHSYGGKLNPADIDIGKKYIGSNGIIREVIDIDEMKRPEMIYHLIGKAPEGGGVVYKQNNIKYYDYLAVFAKWAIEEVV